MDGPLPRRRLGATRIETPRMALGLAALGRPAYINRGRADDFPEGRSVREMASRTHSILDVAYEHGIRAFDAARSYGRAEGFLADWLALRDLEPGEVCVSSKWGYTYVGGWKMDADVHEKKSHDIDTFTRQWQASRKILWSHLDLYQVHSLDADSPLFRDEPLREALAVLKSEFGLSLGVTVTGPRQARTIERVLDLGWQGTRLFDTIQATFNVLEPSAGPALAKAHAEGFGIIVKEGLANGRLAPGRTDAASAPIETYARERGTTADAVALAAVVSRPWADVVLSGAVTRNQLRSNLGAFEVEWDADAESWFEALAEPPQAYWATRSGLGWG